MALRIGTTAEGEPYELPTDVLTDTMAVLGKKGVGKSYTAGVIEEEFAKAGLPFVVLDPVGVHHGIRSSADGKREAYPIVVFGGSHGDVPIERHMGAEVAQAVIEENISCIVDLTELSKTAWREFVRDFCRALYKLNRTPRHVFIEEATEFVPQTRRPELQEAFEAVERLVRMGRNRGLGCTLISQRSAQVAKDVLTQIDILIALRTVGPQDRKALLDMFEAVLEEDQLADLERFKATITKLPNGTAWLWWPERAQFSQVLIRQRETYHAGATPSFKAAKVVQARPDVSALRQRFQQLQEPKEKRPSVEAVLSQTERQIHEITKRKVGELETELSAANDKARQAAALVDEMGETVAHIQGQLAKVESDQRGIEQIRAGFALLGVGAGGASSNGGLSADQVQAMIRSEMASLSRGGEPVYVPAQEAIRKGYQQQAVERALEKVAGLNGDEREALRFLLGHDIFLTVNRVAVGLTGSDSGGVRGRWAAALKSLVAKGIVAKGGTGRAGFKPRIREWVSAELAAHDPTDQETEETYQSTLGRIASAATT